MLFDLLEKEETIDLRKLTRIHGKGVEFRNYLAADVHIPGLEVVERTDNLGKAYNVRRQRTYFLTPLLFSSIIVNKKVLQRERKRHTARRVAVASACYSGGGTTGNNPPWTWDGVPPLPRPGMGYPLPGPGMVYPPHLGWGTPPT